MDDDTRLAAAVTAALERDVAELDDVRREPLEYDAFLAHRSVSRLRGLARADGTSIPWSLIEKSTAVDLASPYLRENAEREFDAYASGLLDELSSSVRAPRLFGEHATDDGHLVLLLEEIAHDGARPLDAAALLKAARNLGTMAGRWHGRVREESWLFTGWIDRHSQPEAAAAGRDTLQCAGKATTGILGDRLTAGLRLIDEQPRVRDIVERLPQTLCHHDAVGANVFISAGQTVLIDWESVGPGPIGADLASLLLSSVRRGDAQAPVVAALLTDALAAYTDGVREHAPSITAHDVRLGFDAAAALRWKLVADVAAAVESGRPIRRGSLPDEPADHAQEELIALIDLQLAAARRALSPLAGSTPAR